MKNFGNEFEALAIDLNEAAEAGDCSTLKRIHSENPDSFLKAIQTKKFQSNFAWCITYFNRETIETLMALGVDLNRHDNVGYAPGGAYPLDMCISRNNLEQTRVLLELGANPDVCDSLNSVSYMRHVDSNAQIAMAQLLIDHGADVNRELPNIPGYTPLCRAIEKGHKALAEFLISKGAVMPEFPDVEQPELNLNTFEARLEKACLEFWDASRKKFPTERFCLFGLETDSDFVILNPLLDSEGAVERDAAKRRTDPSFVARVSLDSDSEFYGQGKEHFDSLSTELNSRYGVEEGRWARSRRIKKLLGIFESTMKKLDAQGLFGIGPDRERIILLISIIDADKSEWNTMLKAAQRLNPVSVFKQFKNSLR